MNNLINVISTEKAVSISSFCAGFVWSIRPMHNLFVKPISASLCGAIGGSLVSVGAGVVSGFLPKAGIPFLVTGLTGSACLYALVGAYESYEQIKNVNSCQEQNNVYHDANYHDANMSALY